MQPVSSTEQPLGKQEVEANEPEFKPLTAEEAAQWRLRQPGFSVWHVVGAQALMMLLAGSLSWLFTQRVSVAWSVLYGGLCIFLPTALMAHGLTSSAWSRLLQRSASPKPSSSVGAVFFWEGVKLVLALAMMWSAPRLVPDLSWLGLLLGLVVVLKVYWLVLLWRRPGGRSRSLMQQADI